MARRVSRKKSANLISDPSSVNVRLPLANKTFHIRHFRYGSPTTEHVRVRERLSSPRSMLRYVILLNIHKGIGYKFGVACCCTLTLTADFLFLWQCTQPAVVQLFPRYSVDIYKCTNVSELISLSRSPCGLQKLWTTPVHVHIAIVTEVIQLPHSQQQACFINVEVWLVTLTDESA